MSVEMNMNRIGEQNIGLRPHLSEGGAVQPERNLTV